MKYHLWRDKGEGTTLIEMPNSPFDHLMDAVHGLMVQCEWGTDFDMNSSTLRYADGCYSVWLTENTTIDIEPGTVIGDMIVGSGYLVQRTQTLTCRLWIEVRQ